LLLVPDPRRVLVLSGNRSSSSGGVWFVSFGACLDGNGLASIIGAAYSSTPIAAILAPLFLGLVADRFSPWNLELLNLLLLGQVSRLLSYIFCLVSGLPAAMPVRASPRFPGSLALTPRSGV